MKMVSPVACINEATVKRHTNEKHPKRKRVFKIYNLFTEIGNKVQSCIILLFIICNCCSPKQFGPSCNCLGCPLQM
jgi:hypothetical protein